MFGIFNRIPRGLEKSAEKAHTRLVEELIAPLDAEARQRITEEYMAVMNDVGLIANRWSQISNRSDELAYLEAKVRAYNNVRGEGIKGLEWNGKAILRLDPMLCRCEKGLPECLAGEYVVNAN